MSPSSSPRSACIFTCSALLAGALAAQDGRQLFQYTSFGNYGTGGFASAVAVVGDVDGDGRQDTAAGDPYWQVYQGGFGRVLLISGEDGSVLRTLTTTSLVGDLVCAIGDVDNNQVPDVVTASTTISSGYGSGLGGPKAVTVFSGASGAVVQSFAISPSAIIGVGDWNNDQEPDLAVVNGGVIEVYGAAGGALVTSLGSPATGNFSLASVLVGAANARRLVVADATGAVAAYDSNGSVVWNRAGFGALADAGNVDGDQIGDVIALQTSGAFAEVLSGLDGATLLTVPGGTQVAGGVDLDGDNTVDLAVGDSAANEVRAYSGANGTQLLSYAGWESNDGMGWGVAMLPAVGTPPRAAVVAGAPRRFNGTQNGGSVHAIAIALPGELDGRIEVSGQGCNFQNWSLRPYGLPPATGRTANMRFVSNVANGPMWNLHVFGLSNTTYGGGALPAPLPSGTLSSCVQLEVSPDLVLFGGGGVFASFAVPSSPAAVGMDIYFQGLNIVFFMGVNFETSSVAKISIGN